MYVGTSSGLTDVVSPMSVLTTEKRLVPKFGNVFQDTTWILNNLLPGLHYWSVQSVDNNFAGSNFAVEGTFTIIPSLYNEINPTEISIYPNPTEGSLFISGKNSMRFYNLQILSLKGKVKYEISNFSSHLTLDLKDYPKGIYIIRFYCSDGLIARKIIKL